MLVFAEEKKQRDIEEKRRRLEESEKKRQAMMQAMKDQASKKGPNFTITKGKDIGVSINWSWDIDDEVEKKLFVR